MTVEMADLLPGRPRAYERFGNEKVDITLLVVPVAVAKGDLPVAIPGCPADEPPGAEAVDTT